VIFFQVEDLSEIVYSLASNKMTTTAMASVRAIITEFPVFVSFSMQTRPILFTDRHYAPKAGDKLIEITIIKSIEIAQYHDKPCVIIPVVPL
jgi:hypothetical protein